MDVRCVKCKGRGFCGREFCPHIAKSEARFKVKDKIGKEDFSGSSPTPFVGHHGYPFLNVGILSIPEVKDDAWEYDAPRHWGESGYDIPKIIEFRSNLINSRFKAHAQDNSRFLDISKEVAMAYKPVDLEVSLDDKPRFRLSAQAEVAPMGPNAELKNVTITSNTSIPRKVDKVVDDYDMRSVEAVKYLYDNEFDENFLTRLLSIGTLGVKKNRKLVPTRWSITATDDILANHLFAKVKQLNEMDYCAYFGGYLGNYYLVLCFPEKWSYELFEMYMPKASFNTSDEVAFTTDYESFYGRKDYAHNCAGGYYAARLPILEKFKDLKKQATVLVLRFITGEYAVPLGVWVVREAVRKAMQSRPVSFESKELMLNYARLIAKKKFGFEVDQILKESRILEGMKHQRKISEFF